jgi:hypothetical protein
MSGIFHHGCCCNQPCGGGDCESGCCHCRYIHLKCEVYETDNYHGELDALIGEWDFKRVGDDESCVWGDGRDQFGNPDPLSLQAQVWGCTIGFSNFTNLPDSNAVCTTTCCANCSPGAGWDTTAHCFPGAFTVAYDIADGPITPTIEGCPTYVRGGGVTFLYTATCGARTNCHCCDCVTMTITNEGLDWSSAYGGGIDFLLDTFTMTKTTNENGCVYAYTFTEYSSLWRIGYDEANCNAYLIETDAVNMPDGSVWAADPGGFSNVSTACDTCDKTFDQLWTRYVHSGGSWVATDEQITIRTTIACSEYE